MTIIEEKEIPVIHEESKAFLNFLFACCPSVLTYATYTLHALSPLPPKY